MQIYIYIYYDIDENTYFKSRIITGDISSMNNTKCTIILIKKIVFLLR